MLEYLNVDYREDENIILVLFTILNKIKISKHKECPHLA